MLPSRVIASTLFAALMLLGLAITASAAGDADRGAALFNGSAAFNNGGAPCLACHHLSGDGLGSGASYGPDLSALYTDFGADGVAGVLESLEFPGMEAIYSERPLTEPEQSDLTAYLKRTAEAKTASGMGLALPVIGAFILLVVLTLLAGRRRMKPTRQPLIDRQRNLINKGGLQ